MGEDVKDRVSGHNGIPESVEVRMICEKAKKMAEKRSEQLSKIYAVLDHMPDTERRRLLSEIIRHYKDG